MISVIEFVDKCVQLFFFASEVIERRLKALTLVDALLQLIQFMIIAFLIFRRRLQLTQSLMPGFVLVEQNFDYITHLDGPSQKFCLVFAGLGILFCLLFTILKLKVISSSQKDILGWICLTVFFAFRLGCQSTATQIYFMITENSNKFPILGDLRYLVLLPMFVPTIYCLFLNRQKLSLWYFHPFIPIIWSKIQDDLLFVILILLISGYSLTLRSCARQHRMYSSLFIAIGIWLIIGKFTNEAHLSELIYCALFVTFIVLALVIPEQHIEVNPNKQSQIEHYWNYTQRKKQTKLMMSDWFLIEQIFIEQSLQENDKDLELLMSIKKSVQNWDRTEHLILLEVQINSLLVKTKSEIAEIFLFKLRMEDQKRNLKTLLEIWEKFQKLGGSKILFRFELYKLVIRLQGWYSKSKNEALYLESIVEVDSKVALFYQRLSIALKILRQIWIALTAGSDIDFSDVQAKYAKILKEKKYIESIYLKISLKCQAEGQLNQLTSFLRLLDLSNESLIIHPNHIEVDTKLHYQVPFLILSDNKITYVPVKFINQYKYSHDELYMSNIQTIIPAAFRKTFLNLDRQNFGIKIQEQPQVIVNGEGYILLVHVESYIFPEFQNGIKYIVFLENRAAVEGKESYFLYNAAADVIEDASEALMEEFQIDTNLFHVNGQQVAGKEVFERIDFTNASNQKALESIEGITTTMSLKKLGSSNYKHEKIKITLRTLSKFDNLEKPRMIIQVLKTKPKDHGIKLDRSRKAIRAKTKVVQQRISNNDNVDLGPDIGQDKFMVEINEKKGTMKRGDTSKSLFPLTIIIVGFVVTMTVLSAGIYTVTNLRVQWFSFMVTEVEMLGARNMLFSDMFFQTLTIYHLTQFKPPVQKLKATELSELISRSSSTLRKTTFDFQQIYVRNIDKQKFQPIQFNLTFKNFKQITNTDNIVLIDFVWQATMLMSAASQNLTVQNATFMMDNFGVINIMRDQVQSLSLYIESYQSYVLISKLLSYFTIFVTIAFYGVFVVFASRIQRTLQDVQLLYQYLPQGCEKRFIRQIELLMQQFEKITEHNQKIIARNPISMSESNIQATGNQLAPGSPSIKVTSKQTIRQRKHFLVTSGLRLLGMLIIVSGYMAGLLVTLDSESDQASGIINFGHRLRLEQLNTMNSLLESYYSLILTKKEPANAYKTSFSSTMVNLLISSADSLTAPEFYNFKDHSWEYLNKNLCLLATSAVESDACSKVYNGILQQGFSKSMGDYQRGLYSLKQATLDNIYPKSIFTDNLMAQSFLLRQISFINDRYKESEDSYQKSLRNKCTILFMIGLAVVIFIVAFFYTQFKQEAERIEICKSMFISSPSEMLSSQQARVHVNETNLVTRLVKL